MHLYGCQQVLLHPTSELKAVLEFICQQANSLINCGIYYARQLYFKAQKLISKYDLEAEYKNHKHFKALYSQAAQQILRSVAESFESFKKLKQAFNQGKLTDKPKPPKYRKSGGLALVTYPKQALKLNTSTTLGVEEFGELTRAAERSRSLKDNSIRIPLGKQVKCWFGIDSFTISMPSNLKFADIKELRILPRNGCFYAEFVYKLEQVDTALDSDKVLGIDPGLNNWLACVSNTGLSFIVDGKHIKSLNRWYNKQVSTLKEGKPKGFWSKKLADITERRNRQMRDGVNKAARLVISLALEHQIGTIVFGWNQGNKQEINLGKQNNQKIVQAPTAKLKARIAQLCKQYGIRFVETEESYTSKASFLDNDELPQYGEKPDNWKPSGRRTKRGLYRTALNWYINADCNGAANIIRKVSRTLGLDLSRLCRDALTRPQRVSLWSAKLIKRSDVYRRPSRSISLESLRL
jgi:IS605 OrfB family transposase